MINIKHWKEWVLRVSWLHNHKQFMLTLMKFKQKTLNEIVKYVYSVLLHCKRLQGLSYLFAIPRFYLLNEVHVFKFGDFSSP